MLNVKGSFIVFVAALSLASCQPTKDDYRKDFVKGCVNRYAKDSSVASVPGRKLVEEYCNCVGDNLNAQMDASQWRTFNKSDDTSMSKYQSYIRPCREDFERKKVLLPRE
ncbi:hypothetical protein [Taibaiella chishuiensis]|uniref:Lipoprotein n=1 Tax=Taibaiella chishuiensis TaxID=1434707 RepID=A0A2P8CSV9_9BACT|nr:hypothetical protein [Taibaiella chishuiensis]PSK88032.1 hypothetical protein B0I18_11663 [Taibaiella chishuiensis]